MEMFTVTMELGVDASRFNELIDAAVSGGIHYWCSGVRLLDDGESYQIRVDGVWHLLNRKVIGSGLGLLASAYPHRFMEFVDEQWDAEVADMVVQLGLFEDVIYG